MPDEPIDEGYESGLGEEPETEPLNADLDERVRSADYAARIQEAALVRPSLQRSDSGFTGSEASLGRSDSNASLASTGTAPSATPSSQAPSSRPVSISADSGVSTPPSIATQATVPSVEKADSSKTYSEPTVKTVGVNGLVAGEAKAPEHPKGKVVLEKAPSADELMAREKVAVKLLTEKEELRKKKEKEEYEKQQAENAEKESKASSTSKASGSIASSSSSNPSSSDSGSRSGSGSGSKHMSSSNRASAMSGKTFSDRVSTMFGSIRSSLGSFFGVGSDSSSKSDKSTPSIWDRTQTKAAEFVAGGAGVIQATTAVIGAPLQYVSKMDGKTHKFGENLKRWFGPKADNKGHEGKDATHVRFDVK